MNVSSRARRASGVFVVSALTLVIAAWPLRAGSPPAAAALRGLDALYPSLDSLYLDLHRNPELSLHETRTAATLAERLRAAG